MTTLVQDSFNRADNATTLGNADTGQTWLYSSTAKGGIISNQAYMPTTNSYNPAYQNINSQNFSVQVKFSAFAHLQGVFVRFVDTNSWVGLHYNDSGAVQYYNLRKRVCATFTTLWEDRSIIPQAGDVIRIEHETSTIRVYINGTLKATITGVSDLLTTTQKVGFSSANSSNSTARFDDFLVEDTFLGSTPTGADVSYQYSMKQSIYADRSYQNPIKQAFYADRQAQFAVEQMIYADKSNSFPLKQSLFSDKAFSHALEQVIYADRQAGFQTEQIIYADRSWQYPLQQQIFSDYILYSADFPIHVTIYQDVAEAFQTEQQMYTDRYFTVPTRQQWYKDVIVQAVTKQIIYADIIKPFATRQTIWADRAYVFATMQEIIDPSHAIIGRIELKGSRDLYVYLKGSRDLTINLKGSI